MGLSRTVYQVNDDFSLRTQNSFLPHVLNAPVKSAVTLETGLGSIKVIQNVTIR